MRNKSFYYPLMIAMLLLLCTPFVTVVYAQSFTVTGTVADSQGGVPGVNVKVKGSTTGTITDMDGKFTLNVPSSKSVLVISYIGYTTQEIPVNNQKILNINLKEDTKVLDEVVVVGYGVQKKSHLTGAFNLCQLALTGMIRRKAGRILTVSSMWGQTGGSCEVHYSAAKAGLIGLTKALAKEEGPSGITVNCVAPGVIDTDMMASFTAEDKAALAEETPVGRLGTAEEVAKLLLYLAGEDAGYITGQVFGVNGGLVI